MSTARKLPSGSWRCRVYSHTDGNGKKIYKSFTCSDPSPKGKRKCEAMAAAWAIEKENETATRNDMTFGDALDQYIASRENVLSPTTIRDYRNIRKKHVPSLMPLMVSEITQNDIQKAINIEAIRLSPKTVRNTHGLISAVLHVYRPEFALNTALPKKVRTELNIPTEDEVKRLMAACKGTELELPVLLAVFGPMRRGEICALRSDDINGNIVHVCRNMVLQSREGGSRYIMKTPKSYAGDRYIDYPDFVAEHFKGKHGRLVELNPDQLTDKFNKKLKKENIPHFRFHDLRHYSASVQHALGVPDAYIMQRGGWDDDGTLKAIYRHALAEKSQSMDSLTNDYFTRTFGQ